MMLRTSLSFYKIFIDRCVNVSKVYTVGPETLEETALALPPPSLKSLETRLAGSFFFACRRSQARMQASVA